jgi:hypothetical protein
MPSSQEARQRPRTPRTAGTVSRIAQQRVDERVREIMARRDAARRLSRRKLAGTR